MGSLDHTQAPSRSAGPFSVLYACQRRLLILGVRAMLEGHPEIKFIGAAVDPSSVMVYLKRTPIDILLVCWSQCSAHSAETLTRVAALDSPPKTVVMAESPNPEAIRDALLLGASGFIAEGCDDEQLADALIAVGQGRIVIETGVRRVVRDGLSTGVPGPGSLTEREHGVLTLIASGLSTKQIASSLYLSPKTVETHRANLMRKLQLISVADVVRYAISTGMIASVPTKADLSVQGAD